jgi:hypothetical protein
MATTKPGLRSLGALSMRSATGNEGCGEPRSREFRELKIFLAPISAALFIIDFISQIS